MRASEFDWSCTSLIHTRVGGGTQRIKRRDMDRSHWFNDNTRLGLSREALRNRDNSWTRHSVQLKTGDEARLLRR